ncbi:MAG TPA: ISNCY family transposase [Longimicrobium sp.]|nr:ISNCY family transposase [Longimicrobium sp.]
MSSFGVCSLQCVQTRSRREDVLKLSQTDRDRLVLLHQVRQGQLSPAEGARRAGLGVRQFRRVVRRFEREGDAVVVHGLRGRRSNRRLPEEVREAALAKAREPLYHDFGPTLLSEHLARNPAIGEVPAATLRRWMIEDGLWKPARQGKRHRRRRERRAAFGELVLMDTSIHPWLEARFGQEIVLIALIDDATSRLRARFFPRDTGAANRRMIVDYLRDHGRMGALYTDQASHFRVNWRAKERAENDEPEALTLIRRALDALEIELILALSPQAKGRVERLFKTLQDRLVKELRVAGISTMEGANRHLDEVFLPFWENRFTVEPREAADALRPLPEGVDLMRIFAETDERVIREDFTFRYANRHFQIEKGEAEPRMPGSRLTIEHRLDGSTRYRWRESYLEPRPLLSERNRRPPAKEVSEPAAEPAKTRPVRKPAPDHPWRRSARRPPQGVGSAGPPLRSGPALPTPSSPF